MAAKDTRPKKRHIGRQKNIGGEYFMEKPKKLPHIEFQKSNVFSYSVNDFKLI